mgnify:CR=1 FL=1
MKFRYVHNYTISPKKIYDGPEPKSIPYWIKDIHGEKICRRDLWNDTSIPWREWFNEKNYAELNNFLEFPTIKWVNETIIVAHVINGPVYLSRCKAEKSFIFVYYTVYEKQPSRYQCYVLGVLESIEKEDVKSIN